MVTCNEIANKTKQKAEQKMGLKTQQNMGDGGEGAFSLGKPLPAIRQRRTPKLAECAEDAECTERAGCAERAAR